MARFPPLRLAYFLLVNRLARAIYFIENTHTHTHGPLSVYGVPPGCVFCTKQNSFLVLWYGAVPFVAPLDREVHERSPMHGRCREGASVGFGIEEEEFGPRLARVGDALRMCFFARDRN